MQTIALYKYIREDGGTTVSTSMPDCEYTQLARLVADEGKTLTNGEQFTSCVDTDAPGMWREVVAEENADESTDTELAKVIDILTGVIE